MGDSLAKKKKKRKESAPMYESVDEGTSTDDREIEASLWKGESGG